MDKEALFKRKAANQIGTVDLDDEVTVTVRGLSRAEVKSLQDENASGHTLDNRMVALALVDPVMTPAEVAEWLDDAPLGDGGKIMDAIGRLSGMSEDAHKSDVAGVRDGS